MCVSFFLTCYLLYDRFEWFDTSNRSVIDEYARHLSRHVRDCLPRSACHRLDRHLRPYLVHLLYEFIRLPNLIRYR